MTALVCRQRGTGNLSVEEVTHKTSNFFSMRFQSEVPGVYQVVLEVFEVSF